MSRPERPGKADAMTDQPLLRVVKGEPTPEELAALTAVVSARAAAASAAADKPARRRSQWSANHRRLSQPHRPGPGAWRAAALPW